MGWVDWDFVCWGVYDYGGEFFKYVVGVIWGLVVVGYYVYWYGEGFLYDVVVGDCYLMCGVVGGGY